jgi:chromate reductase
VDEENGLRGQTGVVTIVSLCASLRPDSWNSLLLGLAEDRLRARGVAVERISADEMRAVPHYDPTLDGDAAPALVRSLRARIDAADALLIATPTYNLGLPSALKAVVDWGSRPFGSSALQGKRVGIIAAGIGRVGGERAAEHLRATMAIFAAEIVEPVVVVASVHRRVEDGVPEPEILSELDALADAI